MTLRIGTGAGFSGDRIGPAVDLAENGNLDYLVFECLAERTIAKAQVAKLNDCNHGYDPFLLKRMRAVLPACQRCGTKIITNMGAANPFAAGQAVIKLAQDMGLKGLRIAVVTGDDVLGYVLDENPTLDNIDKPVAELGANVVSANAYLGAGPIVEALALGADIVIAGRVADPAMFLAPMIFEFGWTMDDWQKLGCGTIIGHLMECGAQITGGYYGDPGIKDVPDIANLGFPIAEIEADGQAIITKLETAGGLVTEATCKEQALYEVHDPANYLQPDVVADFSNLVIKSVGENRMLISGGTGHAPTGLLKVSVGYYDSWIGEGQITYAGSNAVARGKLALSILRDRLAAYSDSILEIRAELIGVDSVFGAKLETVTEITEVRARFVVRSEGPEIAEGVCHEVDSLYLNGPAAGGGIVTSTRHVLAVASTLIPAETIAANVEILET